MDKEIVDLVDKEAAFKKADDKLNAIKDGFYGVAQDYGFHIENFYGSNHTIYELRDNVIYRLFSSMFHFQLLLRQHAIIEQRLSQLLKTEPNKIYNNVHPYNPNYDYSEKEISAILDSIMFPLSSIFDYLSILTNFICYNSQEKKSWKKLSHSVSDSANAASKKKIATTITNIPLGVRCYHLTHYQMNSE